MSFFVALGLKDFDAGKSITRAIGRGLLRCAYCHFKVQKSFDFQVPTHPFQ
jgi:hypothetical protein